MYAHRADRPRAEVRGHLPPAPDSPAEAPAPVAVDAPVARDDALGRQLAAAVIQRRAAIGGVAPAAPGRGPTLARMPTEASWKKRSRLIGRGRSTALKAIDAEVKAYEGLLDPQARRDQLNAIEAAIQNWRRAKGGHDKAMKTARAASVNALLATLFEDLAGVEVELKRERIVSFDPALLRGLPTDPAECGREVFDRFMTTFRERRVRYTLVTKGGQGDPWDGDRGPFACGTFARALADFAKAAGLEAEAVQVVPRNFVTPPIDADFIDARARGNVEIDGKRRRRYFFTQHWVTQIGADVYCPTSGKALSSLDAAELVDPDIGELKATGAHMYSNDLASVSRKGETAAGGGLYDLTVF